MEDFSSFRHGLPFETENSPCFSPKGLDLYYRILLSVNCAENMFINKGI